MRTAEFRDRTYNTELISEASRKLYQLFGRNLGYGNAVTWEIASSSTEEIIQKLEDRRYIWRTGGLDIVFEGFEKPKLRTKRDGSLSFTPEMPSFTLREGEEFQLLNKPLKNHFERVSERVAEVMETDYGLEVVWEPPIIDLYFTEDRYAETIEILQIPLFDSVRQTQS